MRRKNVKKKNGYKILDKTSNRICKCYKCGKEIDKFTAAYRVHFATQPMWLDLDNKEKGLQGGKWQHLDTADCDVDKDLTLTYSHDNRQASDTIKPHIVRITTKSSDKLDSTLFHTIEGKARTYESEKLVNGRSSKKIARYFNKGKVTVLVDDKQVEITSIAEYRKAIHY